MKGASRHYDFITVGNYTKDTTASAAGTRHVDGGGYHYAAHAAALAGLTVAAVTRRSVEDSRVTAPLTSAGIDVFAYDSPQSTLNGLSAHTILVTASIRGEVSPSTIGQLKERCERMTIDVQGFVRTVSPEGRLRYAVWPECDAVLGMTDILKTDAAESEFLTGTSDIRAAARMLAALGPREIVVTHEDGLLVLADGEYFEAAFLPSAFCGRSGRGDTCVGSYASRRIVAGPQEATRWAAAVTSLKLEAEGPIRRSHADVERLLTDKYGASLTHGSPASGLAACAGDSRM